MGSKVQTLNIGRSVEDNPKEDFFLNGKLLVELHTYLYKYCFF